MSRRRRKSPLDPKSVTFYPDPDGYGVVACSWEAERRKTRITLDAARKLAEGWKATFSVEAPW